MAGKKNRKFGRNKKSPPMKRYNAEDRAGLRRAEKRHTKAQAKKAAKVAKPRKRKQKVKAEGPA